jgi:hypothetical protein
MEEGELAVFGFDPLSGWRGDFCLLQLRQVRQLQKHNREFREMVPSMATKSAKATSATCRFCHRDRSARGDVVVAIGIGIGIGVGTDGIGRAHSDGTVGVVRSYPGHTAVRPYADLSSIFCTATMNTVAQMGMKKATFW